MKSTILEIMQTTLGLPNSPIAQVTVGGRKIYADEFATRLAEGLGTAGYSLPDIGCICGCEIDKDTDEPITCKQCARRPCVCVSRPCAGTV